LAQYQAPAAVNPYFCFPNIDKTPSSSNLPPFLLPEHLQNNLRQQFHTFFASGTVCEKKEILRQVNLPQNDTKNSRTLSNLRENAAD